MQTYNRLRARLKAFVRAYVETGDGVKAAKAIRYTGKRADQFAYKLRCRPQVRQAIDEYELTLREEVRQRIYANLDGLRQIANWDPLWVTKPLADWPEEVRCVIQGVDVEERYEGDSETPVRIEIKKYRTPNKNEARKLIMQYQRILDDRPPIQVNVNTQGDTQVNVIASNDPIEASLEYERLMQMPAPELPRLPARVP